MEDIAFYFDNKLENTKSYLKSYIEIEFRRQRESIENEFNHEIDMLRKEVLHLRDTNSQKTDEFFQMELQFQEEEINKKNYKILEKKKEEKMIKLNTFFKKDENNEIRNNVLIVSEKKILIIVDFLLNDLGGDTVMLLNFINMFIKNQNEITLLSKNKPSDLFIENLSDKSIEIIDYNNIYNIDFEKYYFYFVRVSFPIDYMIDEEYYYKLVIYGMDKYIENIKCLNNAFSCVIVQSEQLKTFFIESGINENKIIIKEPIVKKYDFNIKKDKTLKLIYCGTLRDEENILEIIDYFKKLRLKNKNVLLTIVYGKIVGNSSFKRKIENIISKKQDGIAFKHNLNHKDACYEIANSDIGICWRKSGWGDNGEISTKIKEYELYNLQIINNLNVKVAVVTATNKLDKIDNIINNYKNQIYFNKILILVINNNELNIYDINSKLKKLKLDFQLIRVDENYNLGYCLNKAIDVMIKKNITIFSKFDDDDIYEKNYLLEQVYHVNEKKNCLIGKYNVPLFIVEQNKFYRINNVISNNFSNFCRGSTLTFNIEHIKTRFDITKKTGVDTVFIKELLRTNKIYVTSINNYIWVRYIDNSKHTWKLNINEFELIDWVPSHIYGQLFNIIFDKIYVINLEEQIKKKNIFIDNNKHTEINFIFYKGVYGKYDNECINLFNDYNKKPIGFEGSSSLEKKYKKKMIRTVGQIGYLKTMFNIFSEAKKTNYKRIIIFDDDAILAKNFNSIFFENYKDLKDKDIIRLGSTNHSILKCNPKSPFFESPDCDGSYATCYTNKTFDFFLENIKYYNIPFDSGVLRDYKKFKSGTDYTIYPGICIADTFESTILDSRCLYNLSKKLKWELSLFNIVNSLRKISVIIPLYNKETTVINSIKSILNQTYKNIEIIIVNDLSTDNTTDIVCEFINNYTGDINIVLINHTENKGCYGSRNTGIKYATGNYIAFQDPDDYSIKNRLEIQMNDIIKKNIKISYTSIYRFNNIYIDNIYDIESQVKKDISLKKKDENNWNYKFKLGMVTSLLEKSFFDEYGLYDDSYKHSLDLWYIQKLYLKKFNLDMKKDLYNKLPHIKIYIGLFHEYINKNLDPYNFIYYNNVNCYVCEIMNENNISNKNYNRERDYNRYFNNIYKE